MATTRVDYLDDDIKLPNHVGIIMDGNARWARMHNLNCNLGHQYGAIVARRIIEMSSKLGIPHLSLYTLSINNLKRPASEIGWILHLLRTYLYEDAELLMQNNIVLKIVGNIKLLPESTAKLMNILRNRTANNTGMKLFVALCYSGQQEIVDACKLAIDQNLKSNQLTIENYSKLLYDIPSVDLMIRTGNQQRVSDFLLWHIAYAELYFVQKLWPDFENQDFLDAIAEFATRKRTFGER